MSRTLKFLHAADLHIDSPMRGLESYEGAPVERLRSATRRALENMVQLALSERVNFVLLAGDVFNGGWKDFSTGLFFATQMLRLREAEIAVVLVRGNHDAASSVIRNLRLPDNVRELDSRRPETFEVAPGVFVHGQSFARRATTENLASGYPDAVRDAFNIGLLHTCLDGREGHEPYAPTTLAALRTKGYDYWALGHVHNREILSVEPWVVFPGNLQGRHARELGAKGATLVNMKGACVVEARSLDVVRWERLHVDVSDAHDAMDVVDLVRAGLTASLAQLEGPMLAARIVLEGATRANHTLRRDEEKLANELRLAASEAGGDGVWLEKICVATRSTFDRARLREEPSAAGFLARRIHEIRSSPAELAELALELVDLEKNLPADVREGGPSLTTPEGIAELLGDVEETVLARLLEAD